MEESNLAIKGEMYYEFCHFLNLSNLHLVEADKFVFHSDHSDLHRG